MDEIPLDQFLAKIKYDYKPYLDRCIQIGDKTATRPGKAPNVLIRANYERGILLTALANTFGLTDFLEIGTGRGFVSGCVAEFCPTIRRIITVDRKNPETAKSSLKEASVDVSRIEFKTCLSSKLSKNDFSGKFNLFFIDGSHQVKDVTQDAELAFSLCDNRAAFVFDDHRPSLPGVHLAMKNLQVVEYLQQKLLVNTAGWLIENLTIGGPEETEKERDGGMVVALYGLS